LPLGVLQDKSFKDDVQVYDLERHDRIFMWSDGIHEARNSDGDMFGEERLFKLFEENESSESAFDEVLLGVKNFIGSGEQDDDLSMIEIIMEYPENVSHPAYNYSQQHQLLPVEWEMRFEVIPSSFKSFDPLPFLLNVLTEEPDLRGFSGSLYTILSELYSNALEHGVLGLSGDLKKTPEGFTDYYMRREKLLSEIKTGFVHIYFAYSSNIDGGTLTLRVEDSGPGFDFSSRQGKELSITGYSGRGIGIVEKLCKTVRYYGTGNKVEVVFAWVNDD
jgi:two-component system, HptB-dependent secretion and biofilm response regulator